MDWKERRKKTARQGNRKKGRAKYGKKEEEEQGQRGTKKMARALGKDEAE